MRSSRRRMNVPHAPVQSRRHHCNADDAVHSGDDLPSILDRSLLLRAEHGSGPRCHGVLLLGPAVQRRARSSTCSITRPTATRHAGDRAVLVQSGDFDLISPRRSWVKRAFTNAPSVTLNYLTARAQCQRPPEYLQSWTDRRVRAAKAAATTVVGPRGLRRLKAAWLKELGSNELSFSC
jgi:hypothetical protein